MSYIFLFIIILILCWPLYRGLVAQFMHNRAEDFIRKAAGMPSRKKEKKMRKAAEAARRHRQQYGERDEERYSNSPFATPSHIVPKEYAEDVEFEEIKSTESTTTFSSDSNGNFRYEHQVEDAEFTEIK